jgi:hypothetical protein
MTKQALRIQSAVESCARKQVYASWDDAEKAVLAVWRENPRPYDVNPCVVYRCGDHYHYGHSRGRWGPREPYLEWSV